ncbi:Aste57867_13741 [Aphanomyces stellatus]|uniref:Aste57867_13741 protein n=1 Tax=Aphanomyces stellatus TaxID=120398 RepID=A0A485L0L2_9STRA|nr:hypothetical protein As57867_013691 [Aphanomyces stellatus]VFT90574.1 Aste57867_13741 [Aphanomyces stellatus]
MPGVKRVQLDGWGANTAGKVICVDSDRTNHTYQYNFHATPKPEPNFHHHYPATSGFPAHPSTSAYAKKPLAFTHPQTSFAPTAIDVVQVEVAKMCTAIAKEAAQLPISIHECAVCLTSNAHTQIAACGHVFHSRCFLRWYRSNRSCPLCRGHVDRVQLAPTVVETDVIEEVDALMADSDDEDDDMDMTSPEDDSLMEDNDLMSFLSGSATGGAAVDDTELLPIEDMEILEDMTFEEKIEPMNSFEEESKLGGAFTPATTMPNYWMVLNNTQTLLPSRPAAPRVVHIAPRPKSSSGGLGTSAATAQPLAMGFSSDAMKPVSMVPPPTKTNSCRCAGGCRNGRCACVKEGSMCGVTCRCTSCKNPFLSIAMAGIDVSSLIKDDCFMHNLSKIRDMMTKLHERIAAPCCPAKEISILECIDGYTCGCGKAYDFSWCANKLCDREKHKRNHCSKCKRCGDHRDVHCDNCNRCYFAGVSSSFACSCQEKEKAAAAAAAASVGEKKEGEDGEGECCIM